MNKNQILVLAMLIIAATSCKKSDPVTADKKLDGNLKTEAIPCLTLQWVKAIQGSTGPYATTYPGKLTVNGDGDVFYSAWVTGSKWDLNTGEGQLYTSGGTGGYIVKHSGDGTFQWGKFAAGPYSIFSVDDQKNIYYSTTKSSPKHSRKYTPSGNLLWATDTLNFDFATGKGELFALPLTNDTSYKVHCQLKKYDKDRKHLFTKTTIVEWSKWNDYFHQASTDAEGNIYWLTGSISLVKYTSNGTELYSTKVTSAYSDTPSDAKDMDIWMTNDRFGNAFVFYHGRFIKVNANGTVAWTKTYSFDVQQAFTDPEGSVYTISGKKIVKYSSAGNLLGSTNLFAAPQTGSAPKITSIAADGKGNYYIAGTFSNETDFDLGPGETKLKPVGNQITPFIMKLKGCL
ncbi:MAG: hypothetical protein EOP46_19490 [Sphingobacteriaceae bacterium]|nr:MAG: hypothetical protein EOP46_19490 [Sphingobacteriaceae bacterium]